MLNIFTINQNASASWFVEARQQVHQRAFTYPAGTNDRYDFAAANFERDVVQHRRARFVLEGHILKANTIAEFLQRFTLSLWERVRSASPMGRSRESG